MTEKELYVRRAFEQYRENKEYLKTMAFDGLHGIDYTKTRVSGTRAKGAEEALVNNLDQKRAIERQIALVDKILAYLAENQDAAVVKFLELRFKQGQFVWQAAQQIGVSDRMGHRWLQDAYTIGAVVADFCNLW